MVQTESALLVRQSVRSSVGVQLMLRISCNYPTPPLWKACLGSALVTSGFTRLEVLPMVCDFAKMDSAMPLQGEFRGKSQFG